MDLSVLHIKEITGAFSAIGFLIKLRQGKKFSFRVYKNTLVKDNERNITLRFINNGSEPICKGDYCHDSGITLSIPPATLITNPTIAPSADDICPSIQHDESKISILPLLLNPGEWLDLQFTIKSAHHKIWSPKARIAGVTKIPFIKYRDKVNTMLTISLSIVVLCFVSLIVAAAITNGMSPTLQNFIKSVAVIASIATIVETICLVWLICGAISDRYSVPKLIDFKELS